MPSFWKGRTVLVTGHMGFVGSWLCLYLQALGAHVWGYGLSRSTGPSLYKAAQVRRRLAGEWREDITDVTALRQAISAAQPSVVFHLGARAIVREALDDPFGTVQTNVVGTAAVLEAVRHAPIVRAMVVATTDKVYKNTGETPYPYTERSPLGGLDPYGASKAACEMIVGGYRHTYGMRVATARSGNVIGGGDWGAQRLVPNCIRAFAKGETVQVYEAERPFLHVLDSVAGYLILAERLCGEGNYATAYNLGPAHSTSVVTVAEYLAAALQGKVEVLVGGPPQQAAHLVLCSNKAKQELGWFPAWSTEQALGWTVAWYVEHQAGADMDLISMEEIKEHATEWNA